MSEELRTTLENAIEEHSEPVQVESSPAPEAASPAPESTPSAAPAAESVASDAKPKDAPPSIEEVAGDASKAVADKGETPAEREARHRVDRAPQSWKGESKKLWETLPLDVRQEVARRERDITKVMNETAQTRQQVSQMQEVFAPHMERINTVYGGNAMTAVTNLLAVERQLFNGTPQDKAQLVANMVKQFNIDIFALDAAIAGQPAPEAVVQQSNIERILEQRLAPLQQFVQSQQQREQQVRYQQEQQVTQTIEQMAVDPQYPYFDEVRDLMADIVEVNARRGIAISLPDAYTKAVRMNDDTYQASTARDSSQAATQAALQAHQQAQRAKGAAVSVSGTPGAPGTNVGNPTDLRGTIASLIGDTGSRM